MAQWCFLLARTTKGEKKQQGLTIFLVPMDDPAITVRPIRCMMGPHHLNEVFFDNLRVTEADVLGTVDDGWSIVQEVTSFERVGIARYARWATDWATSRGAGGRRRSRCYRLGIDTRSLAIDRLQAAADHSQSDVESDCSR